MGISADEFRTLLARRDAVNVSAAYPVREGWTDGALTVFVAGRPYNALNNNSRSWGKHERLRREWRERTANRIFEKCAPDERMRPHSLLWTWKPETPKVITFTVYGPSRFDDDGLAAVCKSVRDALGPRGPRKPGVGIIQDDRPSAGHVFVYEQAKPTRKAGSVYGVAIRVELKA